jgi:predicted metal-dependent hydrolase
MYDFIIPRESRPMIHTRRFEIKLGDSTPRYWFDGNPWATHLLNAMSCVFPGGERYFMESVLAYQSQIEDPALKRDVRHFCGQEAVHGQQHELLNAWLDRYELGTRQLTEEIEVSIKERTTRLLPPILRLSETAGLEHITAIMGAALLQNPEMLSRISPDVRPLWIWHALEEIEHKAVAFDVFEAVGGSYFQRALGFALGTLGLALTTTITMITLLWRDRQLFNVAAAAGLVRLLVRSGYLRTLARSYFQYYQRNFHPWRVDDRQLMAQAVKDIAPYVKGGAKGSRREAHKEATLVSGPWAPAAGSR